MKKIKEIPALIGFVIGFVVIIIAWIAEKFFLLAFTILKGIAYFVSCAFNKKRDHFASYRPNLNTPSTEAAFK
ncbi:MAG: hypothetical protein JWQ96_1114 [Segetibacter sp.]|jgi:hypothetical protein|nr:hypothetical protein [Segetibacter sp.]